MTWREAATKTKKINRQEEQMKAKVDTPIYPNFQKYLMRGFLRRMRSTKLQQY